MISVSRPRAALLLAALLAACTGGDRPAGPRAPADPGADLATDLLVERYSRGGVRSFYTMALDGSGVAPFVGVPADARRAVPSPDGRTLALLRETPDGDVHLWLMDRDGGSLRPLLEGTRVVDSVAWSPDGRRLAYAESTLSRDADLWVIGADGTGARALTADPLPAIVSDHAPTWSPDGARIAFQSSASGETRIWTVGADGGAPAQLTPPDVRGREVAPAWAPHGRLVAFEVDGPSGSGVGVVGADGGGYRVLVIPWDAGRLAWAPDGRLLLSSRQTGDYEVYALDPESGASANLTRSLAQDYRAVPLRRAPPPPWRGLGSPRAVSAGAPGAAALVAADVLGDGLLDVAALSPAAAQVRLLRGGAAGLEAPVGLDLPGAALALAAADVSRDGRDDLVALGPAGLTVWLGGPGGPSAPSAVGLAGEGRGLALADLDDDGSTDVVTVDARDASFLRVVVHQASPAGGLVETVVVGASHGAAGRACAGDVSGEGAVDVVVLTTSADAPVLLLAGRGDITLGAPVVAATGLAPGPGAVPLCADLDGDRRADLVVVDPGAATVTVLAATGAGFGPPRLLPVSATAAAIADLDRDGAPDLVVVGGPGGGGALLRGGPGGFAAPVALAVGGAPVAVAAADLDGDRWPEVVVAGADGTIAVLPNLGRAPP